MSSFLGGHDYPNLDRVVSSLEHQFNLDMMLIARI